MTTSLAYTGLCHPRRNLWGRRRCRSCLRTCACRGLRLGFSCSLRLFSLAVRFLQWPLGLFSGNSHSVYGSVGGRDPGKVYFAQSPLPSLRSSQEPLGWFSPGHLWSSRCLLRLLCLPGGLCSPDGWQPSPPLRPDWTRAEAFEGDICR